MFSRKYIAAAVAVLAAQAAAPAAFADDSKCCLRVTPYYWAVGIDGSLEDNQGAGSTQIDFNQDIGDVTDNLEFNGSLMIEHNKGKWVNFGALDYMKVENDDTKVNVPGVDLEVETDAMLATVATGYRLGTSERSWIDLMIGVRYAKLDVEASATGFGSVNADEDYIDGIVMLRPRIALGKHWAFSPTISAGGGDSDLVWEMAPELVYTNDCCNLEVRFGYRSVNYEIEENNVELDVSFAGPMIGLGFAF